MSSREIELTYGRKLYALYMGIQKPNLTDT